MRTRTCWSWTSPRGWWCTRHGDTATGTLAQALAGRASGGADAERAGIVHRLDRDTSGLLVVARSEAVHRALRAALSERRIEREYLALVDGRPAGAQRHDRRADRPRPATTAARVHRHRRPARGDHRLRGRACACAAHAAAGAPARRAARTRSASTSRRSAIAIVGDPVYGAGPALGLQRQFLHAARLAFDHPVGGERVDVRSPLPADLAAALERAARGGSAGGA